MSASSRSWCACGGRSNGRILRAAAVILFGGASGLAPLTAQSPPQTRAVSVDVARTLLAGSCAAEDVALSGAAHLVLETTAGPTGTKHTTVTSDVRHVGAAGQSSQTSYRLDNQRRERQQFGCAPGESCLRNLLVPFSVIGPGPNDGAGGTMLLRLDKDPQGRVSGTLVDTRLACRQ